MGSIGSESLLYAFSARCLSQNNSIASASIRNETSARISVPSYLTPSPDVTDPGPQGTQIWRADLGATQNYWMGELLDVSRPLPPSSAFVTRIDIGADL